MKFWIKIRKVPPINYGKEVPMSCLPLKTNITLSNFIMQVFSMVKPKLVEILKESLEKELIVQRDKINR